MAKLPLPRTHANVELREDPTTVSHDLLIPLSSQVSQSYGSRSPSINLVSDPALSETAKIYSFLGMHRVAGTDHTAETRRYGHYTQKRDIPGDSLVQTLTPAAIQGAVS